MRSPIFQSSRARAAGSSVRHGPPGSNARRARATASPMSSSDAYGTSAMTSPVAGSIVSIRSVLAAMQSPAAVAVDGRGAVSGRSAREAWMPVHGVCASAHASPRGGIGRRSVAPHATVITRRDCMAETTEREFWRDLKPTEEVFRPGAGADAYIAEAPTDDERYYVPFSETVSSRPLWIARTQNRWAAMMYAKGPVLVNRQYHPQQAIGYT